MQRLFLPLIVLLLLATLIGCGRRDQEEPTPIAAPRPTYTPTVSATTAPDPIEKPVAATSTPVATQAAAQTETTATGVANETEEEETEEEETEEEETEAIEATDTASPETGTAGTTVNVPRTALSSYRSEGTLVLTNRSEDGTPTKTMTVTLEGAYTVSDNVAGFNEFFQIEAIESDEETPKRFLLYRVDDVIAVNVDGDWLTLNRNQTNYPDLMADVFSHPLSELPISLQQAEIVGNETINGIDTTHYRIEDVDVFMQSLNAELGEGETVESAAIDVWVARQGTYVVQYTIDAEIANAIEFDEEGNELRVDQQLEMAFTIDDANADIVIELPEEVPEPGAIAVPGFAEGEFPTPDDADVRTDMFGLPEITTSLSEEEVIAFYEEVLSTDGWTVEGDFGYYEVSRQDQKFSLIFSTNEEGETVVQVFVEEEEGEAEEQAAP